MKYILLLLSLISFAGMANATETCNYQFKAGHGAYYSIANYPKFIDTEIRGRLNRHQNTFDVTVKRICENKPYKTVSFNMEADSLYILGIDGKPLKPDEVKYTNDDLPISYQQFENEYSNALRFDQLTKKEKQNVTKMFAFVIAESARFSDVENVVDSILSNQKCSSKWAEFSNLLRHWKTMSIFANTRGIAKGPQHVGGQRAFLIAPITSSMVKDYNKAVQSGWEVIRYNYDKRQRDNPVSVGSAFCSS